VIAAIVGCAAGVFALGCKNEPPAPAPPVLAPPVPAPIPSAVDRVEPGEVPEGTDRAFGLPIPRAMQVQTRFPDAVRARGDVPLDALANYVRARVIAERVETGPAKTVFSRVTLKSSPDKLLRVEVVAHGDRTELLVRDVTRPLATDVVKPTDPWSSPGFDPKDRKADPKRFE